MIQLSTDPKQINISIEVEEYIGCIDESPRDYYEGEYNIVPKVEEQKLATRNKEMKHDVTVEKIPVHEFSNDSGTTIVIGGIL